MQQLTGIRFCRTNKIAFTSVYRPCRPTLHKEATMTCRFCIEILQRYNEMRAETRMRYPICKHCIKDNGIWKEITIIDLQSFERKLDLLKTFYPCGWNESQVTISWSNLQENCQIYSKWKSVLQRKRFTLWNLNLDRKNFRSSLKWF